MGDLQPCLLPDISLLTTPTLSLGTPKKCPKILHSLCKNDIAVRQVSSQPVSLLGPSLNPRSSRDPQAKPLQPQKVSFPPLGAYLHTRSFIVNAVRERGPLNSQVEASPLCVLFLLCHWPPSPPSLLVNPSDRPFHHTKAPGAPIAHFLLNCPPLIPIWTPWLHLHQRNTPRTNCRRETVRETGPPGC